MTIRWVEVCRADDIDREDVIGVEYEGTAYAVYRTAEHGFHATDGHCTHEQVLLCEGLVTDDVIECPKHNGRFDVTTGAALGAPVKVALRTYPVRVEDGRVSLGLDA